MKRFALICLFALLAVTGAANAQFDMELIGAYHTGVFDQAACEISAHDPVSQRLFTTSALSGQVLVLDFSDPTAPVYLFSLSAALYGGAEINSVAVHNGIVAVAAQASPKTNPGVIVFFDADGNYLNHVAAGAQPDMIAFTPDGNYVLTCNEGEPNDSYTVDPDGSVTVVDISGGVGSAVVATASFTSYNGSEAALRASGVRIFGPGANASKDFEPEYLAFDANSTTAWVTLQENNALAIIDIATATVTSIVPLGYIDRSLAGNGFDPSDQDGGIHIGNWPVRSFYLPDGIASYEVGGQTYLITANEGDTREWTGSPGYTEFVRLSSSQYPLDAAAFPNAATLKMNANLGRLNVTKAQGDIDGDNDFDVIYTFGGRGFSIWNASGALVFNSGDDFEQRIATLLPANFNANHTNNTIDSRSDDKGPEPEGVTIAEICGSTYAFICCERISGMFIYDVTNPAAPTYVDYVTSRNFSVPFPGSPTPAQLQALMELGPEQICYIKAEDSPNGQPLMAMSNEVSGSITIYQISRTDDIYDDGAHCVSLCTSSPLLVRIHSEFFEHPLVDGVTFTPGCQTGDCNDDCEPGYGDVSWELVEIGGETYMSISLEGENAISGCFCMTIDEILPVEFGSFNAIAGDGAVRLNWNTLSESDNDHFEIRRDGAMVANVESQGNSAEGHSYSWTDNHVVNEREYRYVLSSVAVDGTREDLATVNATPHAGAELPAEFALHAAYPNPFNPSTSIGYSLPEAAHVSLTVFDPMGRAVATLVDGYKSAGNYDVSFDAAHLSSGLYFARMTTGSFSATQKLVLMK